MTCRATPDAVRRAATPLTRALFTLAFLALAAPPSLADDVVATQDATSSIDLEGLARVGWRILHDDDPARFRQDANLREGPLLIGLDLRADNTADDASFDTFEFAAHDVGDRTSDATFALRRDREWALDGGVLRDRFTYAATGEPYPRDATRERAHTRLRWTPEPGLAVRIGWDRSRRRGSAFAASDSDLRGQAPPAGVDPDIVRTHRPFHETFDTLTAGVDLSTAGWRLGLTLSGRRGLVDDRRLYDVPPARRGSSPVRELFRRRAHVDSGDVVLKAARSFLEDDIEASVILLRGRQPAEASLGGSAAGHDSAFEGLSERGPFRSSTVGTTDLERDRTSWELDVLWHATDALDLTLTAGQDDVIDDARLLLTETRRYDRIDVGTTVSRTERRGRTTDRSDRLALDAGFDVTDDLRLRGGVEELRQDVNAPFETRGGSLSGSKIRSTTRRWTAGFDADPFPALRVSVLARKARNDEPVATPSPETSDDVVARVRWRPSERLAVSAVGRHRGTVQEARFDAVSRVRSASLAATWTPPGFEFEAAVTRQSLETRADTSFFLLDTTGFRKVQDTVAYETRDVVVSLHARHEPIPGLRLTAGGHLVRADGDDAISSHEVFAGVEFDVADDVTAGLDVRNWHYDERRRGASPDEDTYDVDGVLLWLEFRFR